MYKGDCTFSVTGYKKYRTNYYMSIDLQILGRPGWDNSLFLKVITGNRVYRFAFDAGENCLSTLPFGELKEIDALFLSHHHMDHISGFDSFVRANYSRDKLIPIYGPENSSQICHHRFLGYTWNLVGPGSPGGFMVHDITENSIKRITFKTEDAYREELSISEVPFDEAVYENDDLIIKCKIMDHKIPSLAFLVHEKDKANIDLEEMIKMGLKPGPWCREIKDTQSTPYKKIAIGVQTFTLEELQRRLLKNTPGQSVGYITDFLLDHEAHDSLKTWLKDCTALIAECAYRDNEKALALQHHHMTTTQIGRLASDAQVKELILFHISDRYDKTQKSELLQEVRDIFPGAHFPLNWNIV
jgi:ribonuclease Z